MNSRYFTLHYIKPLFSDESSICTILHILDLVICFKAIINILFNSEFHVKYVNYSKHSLFPMMKLSVIALT